MEREDQQEGINEIRCGVYRHFKGGTYYVLGVARHSETEENLVVYVRLYRRQGIPITARPLDQFLDEVKTENGDLIPRFIYLGLEEE